MPYQNMTKAQKAAAVARSRDKKRRLEGVKASKAKRSKAKSQDSKSGPASGSLWDWGNYHFKARFTLPSAEIHKQLVDTLEDVIKHGGNHAFCLPRGSAKTTWLSIACLYAILEGYRRYLMLVLGNATGAEEMLEGIKAEMETNGSLAKAYPDICKCVKAVCGTPQKAARLKDEAGNSLAFVWRKKKVVFPPLGKSAGSIVEASGIDSHIRGKIHHLPGGGTVRPDLVLVDDPQTREDAQSQTKIAKLESIVEGDLLGLAGPGVKIAGLVAGTIICKRDLMDRLTNRKLHPAWEGVRVSMLQSFPDALKTLWGEYATLRQESQERGDRRAQAAADFYLERRAEMDAGAVCYWPARYIPAEGEASALQHAMNLRIDRGESVFASEYQNCPMEAAVIYYDLTPEHILKKLNGRPPLQLPDIPVSLTIGIDLNRYGLSWALIANTQAMASSILSYGVYQPDGNKIFEGRAREFSEAEKLAFWKALDAICRQFALFRLVDAAGTPQRIRRVGIDAGYLYQTVRQFCKSNFAAFPFEIYPTRGRSSDQFFAAGRNVQQKGDCWIKVQDKDGEIFIFDVDNWREVNQQGFLLPLGAPSSIDINATNPAGHRELAAQLSAERLVLKAETNKGSLKYMWESSGRNDLMDAVNIARVMASVGGCNPISSLPPSTPAVPAPAAAPQSAPAAQKAMPPPRRKGYHIEIGSAWH